jgi:hypothetical protein
MLHKGFNIEPSERPPGRWRATVTHPDGPLECNGKQVDRYETRDYPSSKDAVQAARLEIEFLRIKRHFK